MPIGYTPFSLISSNLGSSHFVVEPRKSWYKKIVVLNGLSKVNYNVKFPFYILNYSYNTNYFNRIILNWNMYIECKHPQFPYKS